MAKSEPLGSVFVTRSLSDHSPHDALCSGRSASECFLDLSLYTFSF